MRAAVKQGKKRDPIKKSHYRESIREKVLRQQGTELFSLPEEKPNRAHQRLLCTAVLRELRIAFPGSGTFNLNRVQGNELNPALIFHVLFEDKRDSNPSLGLGKR